LHYFAAEIFLQALEKEKLPLLIGVKFWKRYVDDVFCIMENDSISSNLSCINSYHPSIQFTQETETNQALPFLDIYIQKHSGGFYHHVYRKPTHTDVYLHYDSCHHKSQKVSVIDSLFFRAFKLCDSFSLHQEITHLYNILQNNGYPISLIHKRHHIMKSRAQSFPSPNSDSKRLILPFMGEATNEITRRLRKFGFNFGFTHGRSIHSLILQKTSNKPIGSGIYKISCNSCPYIYIGETKRPLEVRMKEHIRDIKNQKMESGVACHIKDSGFNHVIQLNNISLLEPENRYFHRKFKEALYIRAGSNLMNKDFGMEIPTPWNHFIPEVLGSQI